MIISMLFIVLTSSHFFDNRKECRKLVSESYDLWSDLSDNCIARIKIVDYIWSSKHVQQDRQEKYKKCVGISDDEFDEMLFDLQEFKSNLVNAANFANCLCGIGNLHDIKQWWTIALRSPC